MTEPDLGLGEVHKKRAGLAELHMNLVGLLVEVEHCMTVQDLVLEALHMMGWDLVVALHKMEEDLAEVLHMKDLDLELVELHKMVAELEVAEERQTSALLEAWALADHNERMEVLFARSALEDLVLL